MTLSLDLITSCGNTSMEADSPIRERKHGVRVQPWGLRTLTENVLSEFSRSPFNMYHCLTARLHKGELEQPFSA